LIAKLNIFLLVGIFFLSGTSKTPEEDISFHADTDYSVVFGENFNNAITYTQSHYELSLLFLRNGISPDFAWSIVFPELIRYNSLKDKLELASLYTLYIGFGENYSDFSVGRFQMKPSFAEKIESDYLKLKKEIPFSENIQFDTTATRTARSERIRRLDNEVWQTKYLIIFIKLLDYKYNNEMWNKTGKLMFYATAYNAGYWLPKEEILKRENRKCFYVSLYEPDNSVKYSYASISEDYFSHPGLNKRK
jgi:hypothetical protein